jgi:UDP:flavonoid glycosyltransferase YjiC (YdhE family)
VADAVEGIEAHVLLTLGPAVSASDLRLPTNVATESFVTHRAVLPNVDLVVTHAGHGTVMAAVTAGVPLVCTPMGRDQFLVAARVEALGLGVALPANSSVEQVRHTIVTGISDRQLRRRTTAFAAGLDLACGRRRAIDAFSGRPATRARGQR